MENRKRAYLHTAVKSEAHIPLSGQTMSGVTDCACPDAAGSASHEVEKRNLQCHLG